MDRLKPRSSLKRIGTFVLIAIVIAVAADIVGLPHLRWQYTSTGSGSTVLRAEYWSVTGRQSLGGPMARGRAPLIKIMRPKPPVHVRVLRWAGLGWQDEQ